MSTTKSMCLPDCKLTVIRQFANTLMNRPCVDISWMCKSPKILLVLMTLGLLGVLLPLPLRADNTKQTGNTNWATLGWSKEVAKQVEKLIEDRDVDPVSAYLGLNEISQYEGNDAPTQAQKQWLDRVLLETKPQAKEQLQRDFKRAADANDLRGSVISLSIANRVETNMLKHMEGLMAAMKSRVVLGKLGREFPLIWKVEDTVGKYIPDYSEGGGFLDQFSLTPKPGFRLLSVSAHIENVSATSDPGYVSFILPQLIRVLGRGYDAMTPTPGEPSRLAHDQFAFLLTSRGDWIPCAHVSESLFKKSVI